MTESALLNTARESPGPRRLREARSGAALVAAVAIGVIIEWWRLPDITRNTLWAEDAKRFLAGAVAASNPITELFTPYAGYLHVVPRITAALTQLLSPAAWAAAMTFGSCLVASVVAVLVFVCSRDVSERMIPRLLLAAITLLDPLAPREVLGNAANMHWYFLWLAPWLLLYRPRSRAGAWMLASVALLATLTEIQMAVFLPLVFWKLRDRARWPVRTVYLAGVVAQVVVTIVSPRGVGSHLIALPSLFDGYVVNVIAPIYLPNSKDIGWLLVHLGAEFGLVLLIPFVFAAAWALVYGSSTTRIMTIALGVASVVLYGAAVEITPAQFNDYAGSSVARWADPWVTRYGVVPSMMLLAVIPLALGAGRRSMSARAWPRRLAAAALIAVLIVQFVPSTTRRSSGPALPAQVATQTGRCERLGPDAPAPLRAAPGAGWEVSVPCDRLLNPPARGLHAIALDAPAL